MKNNRSILIPLILLLCAASPRAGVLVRFEKKPDTTRSVLKKRGSRKKKAFSTFGWESWDPPPGVSEHAFASSLRSLPGIREVQLPARFRLCDTLPDDPDFSTWQWPLHSLTHPDSDMDAPEAWDVTTGTARIVIAVMDTGIDFTHPDLEHNLWINPLEIPGNGTDDDGNGFADDTLGWDFPNNTNLPYDAIGHGSHVSGIIGASGNNREGICGVCWDVSILTVKVFEDRETGEELILSGFDYILGLEQKPHAINASWGGAVYSPALRDAIEKCGERGILVVASSGNDGIDTSEHPVYPAGFKLPGLLSVAASDIDGRKKNSSNYGPYVSVCAPGENIYSTLHSPFLYGKMSGTSMAAPHVTGAAALLLSKHPDLTPKKIRNRLIAASSPSSFLDDVSLSGGLLHLPGLFHHDDTPPGSIDDLVITDIGVTTATLAFTLPFDDGPGDPVKVLEMRSSKIPITPKNWWEASPLPVIVKPGNPGEKRTVFLEGLLPGTRYYFAVRSLDDAGNPSSLSNVPAGFTTPAGEVFLETFSGGASGWEITRPWDIATSPGQAPGSGAFLYHPEAPVPYPEPDVAISPWIDLSGLENPFLSLSHQYEFSGLLNITNRGDIEIQREGDNAWDLLKSFQKFYTPWKTETIPLHPWRGSRIRIRFRFIHFIGFSELQEELGWWIAHVKILEAGGSPNRSPGLLIY